jgi:Txe/YoeB family toxin of Txe-Axe toxin-antitoxin module
MYALAGYWSRRITDEHRMVYKVTDDAGGSPCGHPPYG